MATIVDELVVKLTLDPKGLSDGQRKALADFKKTQEGVRKTGVQIEDSAKRAQDSMSALRTEVLAFGAAVIGTAGIKDFLGGLASTAQQLGFVSAATGTSVEKLSEWRNAARLAGGTAEGMTALIQHLSGELHTLKVTGNSAIVQWLRPLEVFAFEANGQIKETGKLIGEVLAAIERGKDKGDAAVFFKGLGADQDTINFLLQGKTAVDGYLEKSRQLVGVTKEMVADIREANEAWTEMALTAEYVGDVLLAGVGRGAKAFRDPKTGYGAFARDNVDKDSWLSAFEWLFGWGDRKEAAVPPSVGGAAVPLPRSSQGAGGTPVGIAALISSIQSEFPGVRITSTTGGQHAGSAHGEGRAVDFTTTGDHAAAVARLKRELGDSATVIDAYGKPDSKYWTGDHIHVQFKSAEAAALYRGGAGDTNTSSSNSHVEIGAVNVYPPSGDPKAIASGIGGALKNTDLVNQSNSGQSK